MEIKGKTEELLVKQLKSCERNMQELTNSIKGPNLRIMGIEEGKEVQAKGICNIFNKIKPKNSPNLEKVMPIQVQEASRTANRLEQNRTSHDILLLKQQAQRIEKNIEGCKKEKTNNIKDKPSTSQQNSQWKTLRRALSEVFQALK
jgi:hypothetical protein